MREDGNGLRSRVCRLGACEGGDACRVSGTGSCEVEDGDGAAGRQAVLSMSDKV